jgi:hypothetical protein
VRRARARERASLSGSVKRVRERREREERERGERERREREREL